MRRTIQEVAGRDVSEDDLRHSLQVYNENRSLIRSLYAVKRDEPWIIGADEAYVLVAVGGMIPREEHNALLRTVLPLLRERPAKPQDRIRVVTIS